MRERKTGGITVTRSSTFCRMYVPELFCIPSGRCSRLLYRLSFPYRRTGSTLTRSPSHYAPPMGAVLGRVAVLEYARGHDAASPPLRQARSPKQPRLKGGALHARRCLLGAHRRVGAPHRWLAGCCVLPSTIVCRPAWLCVCARGHGVRAGSCACAPRNASRSLGACRSGHCQ